MSARRPERAGYGTGQGTDTDEAEAVLAAAGLGYHEAHEPYIAAVAAQLAHAGVGWSDWWAGDDDPRDGVIELAGPPGGYAALCVVWRQDHECWLWVPYTHVAGPGDGAYDLGAASMAEPADVTAAVQALLDVPTAPGGALWRPPQGYDPAPRIDDDYELSVPLAWSLAAYATHPAWARTAGDDRPEAPVAAEDKEGR